MADWFKFYENDLDETRLQYAISKLPEVVSVWVGTLSECCRHKSETFRWGSNEIELFGFARRLGISIPKVNEAIQLLAEIDYITIGENSITVLKWNAKQSEYCQWKTKEKTKSVPTLSRECPSRGEERRGDKRRIEKANTPVAFAPFELFWAAYPRKVGRSAAEKKFKVALTKTTNEKILSAIKAQSGSKQWKKDGGQFIPHPATWLNQGRWDDVVEVDKSFKRPTHILDATPRAAT